MQTCLPDSRILTDELSRHAYAHDASPYLLIPEVVLIVESETEMIKVLQLSKTHQVPVTFRAAGTSLSGQAQSGSVLIVLGEGWRNYTILDEGKRIRLQPGLIGAEVNLFLLPYACRLGPDPASIQSAKIGGIAANNASGMCCGIAENTYHTLSGMRVIFADGTLLDTEDNASCEAFMQSHAAFLEELSALRREILADQALSALIRNQYRIKNTLGYSINSFIDFESPLDILTHLMIGSEGTLGFIAGITYRTIPCLRFEAAALLFFESVTAACDVSLTLAQEDIAAIELMDAAALKAAKVDSLSGKAALLIDIKAPTAEALEQKMSLIVEKLQAVAGLLNEVRFITERSEYNQIWATRRGILTAVAGLRKPGTSLINEDVAVGPQDLPQFCSDLQGLFQRYAYEKSCIFGHVREGNLHFLLEANFTTPEGIRKYDAFMQALTDLIVKKYQGALKAEHGTGRNMAPFVAKAWGEKAYRIMERVKVLFDPAGILNPDVILSNNPALHLADLKTFPQVDPLIDRCIECGFCEKVCPSRKLTLTPRQRIVAFRDMQRLNKQFAGFDYRGIDTCAATGLCKTVCPVGINTGDMIRKQRYLSKTPFNKWLVNQWIKHLAIVMKMMKWGLYLLPGYIKHGRKKAVILGARGAAENPISGSFANRCAISKDDNPACNGNGLKPVYYFQSCSARLFNNQQQKILEGILQKLGYRLIELAGSENQCCGLMFNSKGYLREARLPAEKLERFLKANAQNAPILCEMGSCVLQMKQFFRTPLPLYDALEFIADALADVPLKPINRTVMLHITCSIERLGLKEKMITLAKRCARDVIIPPDITCCGFAGEKGFTHPELNASALSSLKRQVPPQCHEGYSMSLTCEMGLSRTAGIPYRSLLYLICEALENSNIRGNLFMQQA